jgi:hypothetical protein
VDLLSGEVAGRSLRPVRASTRNGRPGGSTSDPPHATRWLSPGLSRAPPTGRVLCLNPRPTRCVCAGTAISRSNRTQRITRPGIHPSALGCGSPNRHAFRWETWFRSSDPEPALRTSRVVCGSRSEARRRTSEVVMSRQFSRRRCRRTAHHRSGGGRGRSAPPGRTLRNPPTISRRSSEPHRPQRRVLGGRRSRLRLSKVRVSVDDGVHAAVGIRCRPAAHEGGRRGAYRRPGPGSRRTARAPVPTGIRRGYRRHGRRSSHFGGAGKGKRAWSG